jgi:hypothetical protein
MTLGSSIPEGVCIYCRERFEPSNRFRSVYCSKACHDANFASKQKKSTAADRVRERRMRRKAASGG